MNTIYSIGHSTRTINEFIDLLNSHAIKLLVDIRKIRKSLHNPQFAQQELKKSLEESGIKYEYLKELGGLRPSTKESINDGWENKSFRNYADYMQTDEFAKSLEDLIILSQKQTTVIMCAEVLPWRCHRSLVSDALSVRDIPVCEIISANNERFHKLTSFAVIENKNITYPKLAIKL